MIHIYEEVLKNFYIFDNYHHMASKIQVKMKNIKVFEFYLSNFQQVEFGSGTTSGSVAPSQSSPLTTTSATAGVIKAGWTGLLSTESTALVLESIVILIEHILLHPPPPKKNPSSRTHDKKPIFLAISTNVSVWFPIFTLFMKIKSTICYLKKYE